MVMVALVVGSASRVWRWDWRGWCCWPSSWPLVGCSVAAVAAAAAAAAAVVVVVAAAAAAVVVIVEEMQEVTVHRVAGSH